MPTFHGLTTRSWPTGTGLQRQSPQPLLVLLVQEQGAALGGWEPEPVSARDHSARQSALGSESHPGFSPFKGL